MPPGAWQAARAHQVGYLMGGFGVVGPEIPLHAVVAQARVGQALLAANEMWKLHRITHEEDWRVISHQVVVAFVCVELRREAAHVTPGVRGDHLPGNRGEAREHL